MSLKIPVGVVKILKKKSDPETTFELIQSHFRDNLRETGGCFARVLMCKNFVLKRNSSRNTEDCSLDRDYKFIVKMRSNPKNRNHFPESIKFGGVIVQERCDRNPSLFRKYSDQIHALAQKFGVSDVHDYNIGWKVVKGEDFPVFIDVGFRHKPAKPKKRRQPKKLSWFLPESQVRNRCNSYDSCDDYDESIGSY